MKNISDLHFQLFSSIQKKTKMIKTAVFETQCSGSGCTFNGCESSGSDTCDGQMIQKLNKIQSSINNIRKPKLIDCKSGWKRYNVHCYYLFKTKKMNWFDAQVFCRKQRTTLLQINDASENRWVSKAFPNVPYWIDYTDIGKEGHWVALSSGRNDYSNWSKVNPNNDGNQDCATNNYLSQGQWDDDKCYAHHPPLCETSGKYDTNSGWGLVLTYCGQNAAR
uniref:Lectin BRA-3-like isoform X1 n=1 Tax=Crassostrea virginica TaxID=6565 RepID=A0A8B8ECZ6_CRAVI|nr:lectin BRA-3-like isoform X1 [Crassostrea virginica]XP_022337541.1 lectin BRA-3-like isoform X1 [Crassostrea virginica]XP_022337542.1 lectin BRA-3-like isoform X1 [Crassostrea virginica]XP_022337543.1 lectin BRA-3-like isoform X1 [Crassostrea virginica]XP_022337544.1 lectin BRA-3-like isoform X1 [Crassostrea virginica]XP_022337545.1 lectin BRA-3-like isoform X1 [Crassostrea virginica]XP_022337547.1 lectin BRA-3-like isoform X1 [Crassostrea virginica]XP_022337548.1 lectin BRA-3-like isofor